MLAKAQEIAMGMEAAAKEASELQVSSKGPEINSLTRLNPKPCFHCEKKGHAPENCYFTMQKCKKCDKLGHTKYFAHLQQTQLRKPNPVGRSPPKMPNLENTKATLWNHRIKPLGCLQLKAILTVVSLRA